MVRPGEEEWRDEAHYAPLLSADRSIFAWEWLRRNPAYCAAAGLAPASGDEEGAAHWGLHGFEDPAIGAPIARPVWRAGFDPLVLRLRTEETLPGGQCFRFDHLMPLFTRRAGPEGSDHLLISDGLRTIRLDLAPGSVLHGPFSLDVSIAGLGTAGLDLLALRRLVDLFRRGGLAGPLHRPERRARRWVLELRAHDALQAGASQREIAACLFGRAEEMDRWRIEAPSLRLQVQRIVRRARIMAGGGHRSLMRPPSTGDAPAGPD